MKNKIMQSLLVFICGLIYEAGCVVWVHAAEKDNVVVAVIFSCICATVTIIGVEGFLKSKLNKLAYICGFGVGTAIAIGLRNWIR